MKFVCFGGAVAVADDAGDEEAVVARHRSRRRGLSTFRGKFLSGNKGKKPSSASVLLPPGTKRSPGREVEDVYDMIVGAGKSSSVPSSSALSSSESLDSACTSSSCCSSLSSSSSSFLEVLPPPVNRPEKRSPAAGAAAVVVCLVMLLLCGRVGSTLLTLTALYLFPLRWPARAKAGGSEVEHDVASAREEETMKRKVVTEGFLVRNRNK